MAKKSKRKVSAVSRPTPANTNASATATAEAPAPSAAPTTQRYSRRPPIVEDFNPDYSYVIKDLKRIGALAGTFFVILIALSFIIK